jgi:hypothetical protein
VPVRESAWVQPHVAAPGAIAKPPTAEAWYAAIERLRRDGRSAEADRELEALEKAYPGWLEAHGKKQAKP